MIKTKYGMKKIILLFLFPVLLFGQEDYKMGKYLNFGLGYAPYDSPIQGEMALTSLQTQLEAGVYLFKNISATIGFSYFNEKSSQAWKGFVGQLGYRFHLNRINLYLGVESWPIEPQSNNFTIQGVSTIEVPIKKWDGYIGYQFEDGIRFGIKRKLFNTPWMKFEWSDDEFSTFDLNGGDIDNMEIDNNGVIQD